MEIKRDMSKTEGPRKRILVTGGAGFIGSHLCRRLLREGHTVVCLDNLQTGSLRNLEDMLRDPRFTFLQQDVTMALSMEADEIYHLACPASPAHYQEDPIRTAKTSFLGAISVLELARRTGARVLLTSTSEVYGEPLVHPQTEDYWGNVNPDGIRACYDEGKRMAETLFFDYHRQYDTDIRVVRIFNTYGPSMDPNDGRVISNFIIQALSGDKLTVYGDGSQTRCFCYIDDMVEALLRMMAAEGITGPVNLGNPEEITIRDLAETVCRLTGAAGGVEYRSLPDDDPSRRRPDIRLAAELLGWRPETGLEEGLSRTIAYFRARGEAAPEEEGGSKQYPVGLLMGVFDLFHVGHLKLIQRARARCGHLRVAVLSDELAIRFKGQPPAIPLEQRMEILRALREVDEVVGIYDTPSRLEEWKRRPFDCFFSGDDYRDNAYWAWEREKLRELGADLVFFPYSAFQSTTQIRARMNELTAPKATDP